MRARGARPLTRACRWEDEGVIGGFATAEPNPVLLDFVRRELAGRPGRSVLDLGCGAGRNACPVVYEGTFRRRSLG